MNSFESEEQIKVRIQTGKKVQSQPPEGHEQIGLDYWDVITDVHKIESKQTLVHSGGRSWRTAYGKHTFSLGLLTKSF